MFSFQILLKQDKSVLNWKSALILKLELKLSELKLSGDIYQEIISGLKETFRLGRRLLKGKKIKTNARRDMHEEGIL